MADKAQRWEPPLVPLLCDAPPPEELPDETLDDTPPTPLCDEAALNPLPPLLRTPPKDADPPEWGAERQAAPKPGFE